MKSEPSKPKISPELLKVSTDASKLTTEVVAKEVTPLLKDIMKRFHEAADDAYSKCDTKSHQTNSTAANKIAKLIMYVYKL